MPLGGDLIDGAVDAVAGVADHHVEPAEALDGSARRATACRPRASRPPTMGSAWPPAPADLVGDGLEPIRATGAERDGAPLRAKRSAVAAPDA